MADVKYCAEYAKTGRSGCKKCKKTIEKGTCRIGKVTPNPFSDDGGDMKVWYHVGCMFESFQRARAATKVIETAADVEGFADLKDSEKDEIKELIKELESKRSASKDKGKQKAAKQKQLPVTPSKSSATPSKSSATPSKSSATPSKSSATPSKSSATPSKSSATPSKSSATPSKSSATPSKSTASSEVLEATDGQSSSLLSFQKFQDLCSSIENEPSYNSKSKLVKDFIRKEVTGNDVSEVYLLVKMLLPGVGKKRVYNLQSKQMVKLLSQVFLCDVDDMIEDLGKGDVAETAVAFFQQSSGVQALPRSTLKLHEVDKFLDKMATLTREEEQLRELKGIIRKCSHGDLRYIIRLLKNDLRMNAGAKPVFDALDPNAYKAFQVSHDIFDVVQRVSKQNESGAEGSVPGMKKVLSIRLTLMTPVKPMLAEACKSIEMAMKKCPEGMFAELKYDGERVQIHVKGGEFQYFSRSLKSVTPHKVAHIKDYLPKACPHGNSMILDSEVLMVDLKTGKPLPFGTLGVHKKNAFEDAACCLFVFDILYFNGENLLTKSMKERRTILEKNISPVKNRIMLSEQTLITKPDELQQLMSSVMKQGLEGLVLKDLKGVYGPGKRHWLKMKKDYLAGGSMADSADLVVLGAYYGTGNKGGMMSVFLMGLYDPVCKKWKTVAKCGNGHDDATITKLQSELNVVKIQKDPSKVPSWLSVHKTLIPDFVVADPKTAPVWEIAGAEFSQSSTHTADGISIRFPRVTRIRDDKDWQTATDLDRLKVLYKTSKESTDVDVAMETEGGDLDQDEDMEQEMPTSSKKGFTPKREPLPQTEEDEVPAAKKKRVVCKYGAQCYQTSLEHRRKYSHPKEEGQGGGAASLPNLFSNKVFYLDKSSLDMYDDLKRYIIAYDGEITDDAELKDATHFIGSASPQKLSKNIPIVRPDWIWDTLKAGKLQMVDNYLNN